MGQRNKWVGAVLGLVLVASFVLMPSAVLADEVTVYLTEDSYIDDGSPNSNYGSSDWLLVQDYITTPVRSVLRIPDQSGGGNITQVLLRLWYGSEYELDAEGKKIRVYRLLEDFVEDEVTWNEWKDGWDWTNPGGDYTAVNYAETEMPSYPAEVVWNITEMAEDAWITDGEDLYVIVRYKYETKGYDPDTLSISWFPSAEYTGTTYDPRILVTYEEAIQTPEVDADMSQYTSSWVELNVYPTLYDWATANVTIQVGAAAGPWTLESGVLTVTDNNAVVRNVTGLNKTTSYNGRAKLVYASGTVYSGNVSFTTPSYDTPVWDATAGDIGPHSVNLTASWTGNNDEKDVNYRVQYKRSDIGSWTWSSQASSNGTTASNTWGITELQDNRTYDYRGRFTIEGLIYFTPTYQFDTSEGPVLDVTIEDVDYEYVQLRTDYQCEEVDEISLYARIREDGSTAWTNSDTRTGLTGNGTEYFLFEDLFPAEEYDYEVIATYDGGSLTALGSFWTAAIDVYPVMTNLDATFVLPNIIRVEVDGVLNDVSVGALDPEFYVQFRPTWELTWQTSVDRMDITGDGTWYVDIQAGDELLWDSTYDYYGVIDFTVGTNVTAEDVFAVPAEPFAVETVEVVGIGGTQARFVGRVQLGDLDSANCKFLYWVQGDDGEHSTAESTEESSGQYSIEVTDLVYGEYYSFRAYARDPDGVQPDVQGDVLSFRAGYWGEDVEEEEEPDWGGLPWISYYDLYNWFRHSTAGHWTIMLGLMGLLALLFWRYNKHVAIIMVLAVLGGGIAVGWVDTWIIVLLALGAGFTIYRWVSGRSTQTGGL